MKINPELIEWSVVVAPAMFALLLLAVRAQRIQIWCVKVIGTSAISLVGIGLTLMRLTAQCAPEGLQCDSPRIVTTRLPGIIQSCQRCADPSQDSLWLRANQLELQAQAVVAALCLGTSLIITIHFILWCKKHVFAAR
jgi:hypothetical protein